MIIKELDDRWRVYFFPEAEDSDITNEEEGIFNGVKDKWAEKGYIYRIGVFKGQHVPKYADYGTQKYSLEEAKHAAEGIKTCSVCTALNSQVAKVEKIILKDRYELGKEVTPDNTKGELTKLKKEIVELKSLMKPERKNVVEGVMSDITKDVIKTIFTVPGRIDMYLTTGDEAFIEDLIPERPTKEDVLEIRAQVADFWAGDIGRVRNEEQMRSYAKQQRDLIKTLRGEEIEEEEPKKKKFGGKKVKVVA